MSFCRNKKELAHPGNKGLDIAVALLKPIKDKYASVTWAGKHKWHLFSLYRKLVRNPVDTTLEPSMCGGASECLYE